MKLAVGISVHTGWAVCVVAGGDWRSPRIDAREHLELLGDPERFVFHRAAEMPRGEAAKWVARAEKDAVACAGRVLKRLAAQADTDRCAIVAKGGALLPLDEILASHPRIHTAEGLFYRDALRRAAESNGLTATVISPNKLDPKDPRLADVGRAVGRPWDRDWKLATLAAWRVMGTPDRSPGQHKPVVSTHSKSALRADSNVDACAVTREPARRAGFECDGKCDCAAPDFSPGRPI